MRDREGKSGGGKGFLLSEDKTFTLATSNFHTLFILDGTRVGDVRVYEDSIMQTVIQRWGTGGGNVPSIMNEKSVVRRLTPTECERLQGFPDHYVSIVSNTQGYKALGNSFTVPVIKYILKHIF